MRGDRKLRVPLTSHLLLLTLACAATTTRPYFTPLPSAAIAEVELGIPQATRALSEAMARDSIALAFIHEGDGYIDSGWLDAGTLEHTRARPLGDGVVRVRAWVTPARQFWSELQVEATYRPIDDPSRPERELDTALPDDHPLQRKLAGVIRRLIEQFGDAEALKALQPAAVPTVLPDSLAKPDTGRARPDTTRVRPDTLRAKPDTIKPKPETIPT